MSASPFLYGNKCRLEPFTEQHLSERYAGWLNSPEVVRYSEQRHKSHDLASCRDYAASFEGSPNFFWAIIATDATLGHIGNLNAYVDATNGVADVGILVGERRAWRQGFGIDAWLAACHYLLIDLGLRKITAGTLANNFPMLAVMKRSGMIEEGRRRGQVLWEGVAVDMIEAGLTREDLAAALASAPAAGRRRRTSPPARPAHAAKASPASETAKPDSGHRSHTASLRDDTQ